MNRLITYYTKPFFRSKKKLISSALKYGVDYVTEYHDFWLKEQDFYRENKEILSMPRGAGYWIWKPYIIYQNLVSLAEEDFLIYSDASVEFVNDVKFLVDSVKENDGFGVFRAHGYKNCQFTKRDCFVLMDCDSEKYWFGEKSMAGFIIFQKNLKTISFVKEWLDFATNKNIVTDEPNICGKENFPDFVDHRHDQSILSLLALKFDITHLRDPTQFGNPYKPVKFRVNGEYCEVPYFDQPWEKSQYPTILNHHRKKNNLSLFDHFEYRKKFKQWN